MKENLESMIPTQDINQDNKTIIEELTKQLDSAKKENGLLKENMKAKDNFINELLAENNLMVDELNLLDNLLSNIEGDLQVLKVYKSIRKTKEGGRK